MMTEQAESFAQNDDDDVGCIVFFFCFVFVFLWDVLRDCN